jgi:predicted Zn finger-like uncharacterized protein
MSIRIICPSCRTLYALADHLAGKTVRCKKCNDTFTLPSTDTVSSIGVKDKIQTKPQTLPCPLPRDEEEEAPRLRRQRRDDTDDDWPRPYRRSNRGLIIGLIAGGIGLAMLLMGGGILALFFLLRSPSRAVPQVPNVPVRRPVPPAPLVRNGPPDIFVEDDGPPNADAVARALHHLKSANVLVRHEALRKLKDMLPDDEHRADVIKGLGPLINDADHFTRHWAIEALGVWGNKDAVPILLKAMRDGDTRHEAMKALGRLKDERAVEPIAARLEEISDLHAAAEALKAMGPMAEKAVLARLNHHEIHVRWMVCEVLETIGTEQSIPALEKAEANDFHIKFQARKAINAIKARQ